MSRRRGSPVKVRTFVENPSKVDERQNIISKLKQDLVVARGKEKEVAILHKYVGEVNTKNRVEAEKLKKKQYEFKVKSQNVNKAIAQLKRELEHIKVESKNAYTQLGQQEAEQLELKKHMARKNNDIERLKKDLASLNQQNDELMVEYSQLQLHSENLQEDIMRIQIEKKNLEKRINDINNKIIEVKAYLGDLNDENKILKQKLRGYESENNNISQDIDQKEDKLDGIEQKCADKTEEIKGRIDAFIQLQHTQERYITQTKHKLALLKSQREKGNEISQVIAKTQKRIAETKQRTKQTQEENREIDQVNNEYDKQIQQMKKDYESCQVHLENVMKLNSLVRQELEKYLREDEQVIATLQKKRIMPPTDYYAQLRQSRKNTARTARTFDQY